MRRLGRGSAAIEADGKGQSGRTAAASSSRCPHGRGGCLYTGYRGLSASEGSLGKLGSSPR